MKYKILPIFTVTLAMLVGPNWGSDKALVVIDVRSNSEWRAGHLATAIHLPLNNIAEGIGDLVDNKQQKIYLYCRSGNRSGKAMKILQGLGYSNVINAGGIAEASQLLKQKVISD